MASSSTVHAPERSKIEQIVVEFFAKSLHIILESRIPALGSESDYLGSSASSSTSGPKTRDRWFNLALGDCANALENFEPWCKSFSDPMVVDILLDRSEFAERRPSLPKIATSDRHWAKGGSNTSEDFLTGASKATVLERWTVQFEQCKRSSVLSSSPGSKGAVGAKLGAAWDGKFEGRVGAGEGQEARMDSKGEWLGSGSGSRSQRSKIDDSATRGGGPLPAHVTEVSAVYKRTLVMLRSLYSRCRLLPAYRMFKILSSATNCCDFSLSYRVSSTATPLSEPEKRDVSLYNFTPVETAFGRMCLSVEFRLTPAVVALEVMPSILPRIIPDYVGSPTTDPLKRFTGEPHSLPDRGTSLIQGIHMVSVPSSLQSSPPCPGLGRRHSWSGRIHQLQPSLQPPSSPSYRTSRSPSPSYPFHPSPPYPPSPYSPYSQKHLSSDLLFSPLSSPLSSVDRHAGIPTRGSQPISIDNRCSPPFSPSPSPSPPALYQGSDPVSIPRSSQSRGSKLSMGDTHQRNRSLLPPLSSSAKKPGVLLRSSSESPGHSLSHPHQSRSFESPLQMPIVHYRGQQVCMNEGTGGTYTTENLLHGQSQTTLSRSSSKTGLGDDGEDDDCLCPFAVDDMDADEKRSSRTDSFGHMGEALESLTVSGSLQHKSSNAAVGALIRILNSAAPLGYSSLSSGETPDFRASERLSLDISPRTMVPESRVRPSSLEPTGKMAGEALEELQLHRNMRDLIQLRREEAALLTSSKSST